jgi:hypothetical protein
MASAIKKASWRGSSFQPTHATSGLSKRRWTATLVLGLMSIALGFILWQWWILRDSQSYILSVVINQSAKQSGQQDNLSIAPLRFTANLPKSLTGLRTAKSVKNVEENLTRFQNNYNPKIRSFVASKLNA